MNTKSSVISPTFEKKAISSNNQIQNFDDFTTWRSFKNGNESAFILIYENFFDILYNYGYQFTDNEGLIQDAIQDLFIELRNNRERLGDTSCIKFYLLKCLKRKIIKESAKWYNSCETFSGDMLFDFAFSHEQVIIEKQIHQENVEKLNAAIKLLPVRKKEAIYYFYYQGLSYEQIKEIMDLSHVKSARNLIYNAVNFLREELNNIF